MQHVTRQLEKVRRRARLMLLAQPMLQWLAAIVVAMLVAGMLDFRLRLPGWMRLAMGVLAVGISAYWLLSRLTRAARFNPGLSTLAMRAERLYPQLKGSLASAVEFSAHADQYEDPEVTAQMVRRSVDQAQQRIGDARLSRLIEPSHTLHITGVACAMLALLLAVVVLAPAQSLMATQRWLLPLSDAQWPRRTEVRSLFAEQVWPSDAPLRLRAKVNRGLRPGMRTWANYRLVSADGLAKPWQSQLMNEQAGVDTSAAEAGAFESLIDVAALGSRQIVLASHAGPREADPGSVEIYFTADDDQTVRQMIRLVDRPTLRGFTVRAQPPDYARGLVNPQQVALDQQAGSVATFAALEGSRIDLVLQLNKPIPQENVTAAMLLPGLGDVDATLDTSLLQGSHDALPQITASFILAETVQSIAYLQDEHGLNNESERLYRIETVADRAPAVSLTQPQGDESVLATALIDVEAVAQDDVGVESLRLEAALPARSKDAEQPVVTLDQIAGRRTRMTATSQLDLSPLSLRPGDDVDLSAVTQDVFDLHGMRHDPVRSTVRRLRIIDAATLVGQIRTELAGLRQQVIRLEDQQRTLTQQSPDRAGPAQRQLSERLDTQQALIESINDRLARNRLAEPQLSQLLERAAGLLEKAEEASRDAAGQLNEAERQPDKPEHEAQARQRQEQVAGALDELSKLLDQGRDALTLQLQLQQLVNQQKALSLDTRETLPRTLGQSPQELSAEDRERLRNLSERQQALGEQAQAVAQQMQQTAQALSKQGQSDQEKAAAQALAEAAAIAQRQGLQQQMQQAAKDAAENKLSAAGDQQSGAEQTMQSMLNQLARQQQLQQEILRRRLMQLADLLRKLADQQQHQLTALEEAQALEGLEQPLTTLRSNTIAVATDAGADPQTQPIGELVGRAGDQQGRAIQALRAQGREDAAAGEQRALEHLREAIAQVEQMSREAAEEQMREQRDDLREAYEQLAKQQDELRERTAPLAEAEELSRRQRAQLVELGNEEADLRVGIHALKKHVEKTLVFQHLHSNIDRTTERVTTRLRSAEADRLVLTDQAHVSSTLRRMAEALAQANEKQEFANMPQDEAGGGGGGGEPPMVPPVAELKLLRGMQQSVLDHTRELNDQADRQAARRPLVELSVQQRELAALGEQLIENLNRQITGPGGVE